MLLGRSCWILQGSEGVEDSLAALLEFAFVVVLASLVVIPAGESASSRTVYKVIYACSSIRATTSKQQIPCGNDNQRGKGDNKGQSP
jgi:hypothetical protein